MRLLQAKGLGHARLGGQVLPDVLLQPGQRLAVLGPSGSGKSTLIHLLSGWLEPAQGELELAGQNLLTLPAALRHAWCAVHVGVVTHGAPMLAPLSVKENLEVVARFAAQARTRCARANLRSSHANAPLASAHSLLEQLDIADLANRLPGTLSQGQFQRAALARALAHSPSILLADEPTSHLDDANCSLTLQLLERMAEQSRAAMLVVTHDMRVKSAFAEQIELPKAKL